MKNITTVLFTLILGINCAWSHALWLETNANGTLGKEQEIRVIFGEYNYGITETVGNDAFKKVDQFTVWIIAPDGKKEVLKMTPKDSFYLVKYTPKQEGLYTVELDNDQIDVMDYTKYNFGIFKTHYHSTAKFKVGKGLAISAASNNLGLVIQDISSSKDSLKLKVLYKGEVLKDAELTVDITDQWSKKCYTNELGEVTLVLPWKVNYLVEVTKEEKVPGEYKGEKYEFIWHCATYMTSK